MKTRTIIVAAIAPVALTASAGAKTRTIQTNSGRQTVVNANRYHHNGYYRGGSRVSIGIGFGFPGYYGGGYGGYPYYGGYGYGYGYPGCYGGGYYPYRGYYGGGYGGGYYGGGGYGGGYYGGGYNGGYSNNGYARTGSYRSGNNGNIVAQVQSRLARAGYYRGAIDGVMGPRTHYAIRAYESRHGLPADGQIDRRLLATLGLA